MTSMPLDFHTFNTSCNAKGHEAVHQKETLFYIRTRNGIKVEMKHSRNISFYVAGHGLSKDRLSFIETEIEENNMRILERMSKFLKIEISDDVLEGFWTLVDIIENIEDLIQRKRTNRFYDPIYSDNVFMYVAEDISNMIKYCPPGSPWSRGKIFDSIDNMITVGYSIKGRLQELSGKPAYREHPVPIDWCISKAFEMFQAGSSVEEVAQMFKRNIKLVRISDEEAHLLDSVLKLQTTMPPGFEDGHDPLTRLTYAGILLENNT
jgi:hypothetical protein